jgi:hypothetical protein
MKTRRTILGFLSIFCLLFSNVSAVFAAPPSLPSSFHGTVKVNGGNVSVGTSVTAWINGIQQGATTAIIYQGDTVYSMDIGADNTETPAVDGGIEGQTVIFHIGDLVADQTGTWSSGTSVSSNLTATNASNVPPVISQGDTITVNMSEDGSPVPFSLTLDATDANTTDILTWSISTQAAKGTASVSGTGSSKSIGYSPNPNIYGTDSFVVQVSDGNGGADTITVTVEITPQDDLAVITGQNPLSTPEETAITISIDNLIISDPDHTPDQMYMEVSDGDHYARSGYTITPEVDFNGDLSVPVRVHNGIGYSNIFPLVITVTPVNDAPVITGQATLTTSFNTALTITLPNLVVTDVDNTYPNGFSLTVMSGTNYTFTGNTITPTAGFSGTLTVPVKVNDGIADSNTFPLQVTVTASTLPTIITTGTLTPFASSPGVASAEQTYTVSGVSLTANLVVTAPADFQVSTTSGSGFGTTVSLTPISGTVVTTTVYVRFNRATTGTSSGNIANTSSGATTQNVAVTGTATAIVPTITIAGTLTPFTSSPGVASAEQTYTVSGVNLTANLVVTAPADFQVSATSGSGFASTVTLTPISGTVVTTTVYVRFNRATTGTSSGNIANTSTGATTQNVAVSGTASTVTEITFTGTELLGRPTNNSISISIVPNSDITLYYQYATTSGGPYTSTANTAATAGQPKVVVIDGLSANTHYYYRLLYSTNGGSSWITRTEHSFWTARATGSTYSFTITSDGHVNIMLGNATTWGNTLNDVAADHADFEIDLGDTVAMDGVSVGGVSAAETAYKNELPYFNRVSANSPVFLVAGNHEQQEGWHLLSPLANSLPVIGTNAQNKYFLDPAPNSFYTGDTGTLSYLDGDHLRRDYYSWTWGDALYVVIDPYWFSTTKPYVTDPGGGETDTTGSGDSWDWTLGLDQFNWLKSTLQNSNAKYKFVFAHQMVGGGNISGQSDYGHGGANYANLVEWGGYNEDGTTWGWDTKRAGWGSQPIHQMMVANGVSAFFHGHDHQYGYEKLDGMVYQAVPAGGFSGSGFSIYSTGSGNTIKAINSSGHLLITVGPSQSTVDYIQTGATSPVYSYTIQPSRTLTTAVSPSGSGTITPAAGTHVYPNGYIANITATAASGYLFDHWSGACSGSGTCQVTMDGNKTVTANFVPIAPTCYTLTVNHTGSGGDPTANPVKSDSCPTNGQYVAGAGITLTATPASGYQVSGWTGTIDDSSTSTTNTLTMPSGAQAVGVTYSQIEYTLTVISDHGTVAKNPDKVTYHEGDVVQLTATAATGWTFASWSDGATGTTNPVNVTIHGNLAVTANYTQNGYTLAITSAHGTVARNPDQATYHEGDVVQLTATAATGWTFASWSDGATGTTNPVNITIHGNLAVTANYTQNEYTLIVLSNHGTPTRSPNHTTYHLGDVVTLGMGAVDPGWTFTGWDPALTANQITITGDNTVTAVFTQNTYTLTVSIVGNGTVNRTGSGPYHYGDSVILTAIPTDNYNRLANWSESTCLGRGPCTINITGDASVTATFEHSTFYDVPFDYPNYPYIEALYKAGFTAGCQAEGQPLMFCPEATMLRAESSVFMLRGLSGTSYKPPEAPWNTFHDDWTAIDWAEKWAEGMWNEGLTAGCQYPANSKNKLFCPYTNFTREEGAVFALRIAHGKAYTPPAASGTVFADASNASYWSTKWLEEAYSEGLLLSCGTQNGKPMICPTGNLSRSWTAYMVALAKDMMP